MSSRLSFSRSFEAQPPVENEVIFRDRCDKTNEEITYKKGSARTNNIKAIFKEIASRSTKDSIVSVIKDVFLPKGYPNSVSADYTEYQVWDTCQAFCSSISGTLAMQAVMQGIGVGSETATPVAAAIAWLMKDGTGMVGSILFAWSKGSKFDADCKKWRLFADILNDMAMCLELYIPNLLQYSMYLLCISTAMKALVGVAGGATRAALTNHQAILDNAADVAAKDNSQEIFVNLCALLFGIVLLKTVTEREQIWAIMFTFILFHLIFNYKAVSCLRMNVYNGERYCLSLRSYLATSVIPSIEQVNRNESVFLTKGSSDYHLCGFKIYLGKSLKHAILCQKLPDSDLAYLTVLFEDKNYLILPHLKREEIYVAFRENATDVDIMKAYFHALFLGVAIKVSRSDNKLPVILRARLNSPVLRIKNVLNFYVSTRFEIYQSEKLPVLPMIACDDLIDKEFRAFFNLSSEEHWNVTRHLLIVDDWKSGWRLPPQRPEYKQAAMSASSSSVETSPEKMSPKTSTASKRGSRKSPNRLPRQPGVIPNIII